MTSLQANISKGVAEMGLVLDEPAAARFADYLRLIEKWNRVHNLTAVRETSPDILGMSALLTTTVPQQKVVIEALKKEGLFDSIKVMVGGAPVTQEWADEIGADGFAPDAPEAVSRAQALLGIEVAA